MNAKKAILRSSTNAEDLKGFNGAGLYESISVKVQVHIFVKHLIALCLQAPFEEKDVQAAVLGVWVSVWNHRAFAERRAFGIDESDVVMSILVQPFIDGLCDMFVFVLH